jgi:hypothetical protein
VYEGKVVRAEVVGLPGSESIESPLNGAVFAVGLGPVAGDDDGDVRGNVEVLRFARARRARPRSELDRSRGEGSLRVARLVRPYFVVPRHFGPSRTVPSDQQERMRPDRVGRLRAGPSTLSRGRHGFKSPRDHDLEPDSLPFRRRDERCEAEAPP